MSRTIKNKKRRKKNKTNKNMKKIKGGAEMSRRHSVYNSMNYNSVKVPETKKAKLNARAEEPRVNNETHPLLRSKSQIFQGSRGVLSQSQVDIVAYDKPYSVEVELIRSKSSVKIETEQDKMRILARKGITMIYDENARRHNFYIGDKHIGFADCCFISGTFSINTIYINESERNKRYGKTILKYLIESAFDNLHATVISLIDKTRGEQYNPTGIANQMYSKMKFEYKYPEVKHGHYLANDMILTDDRYKRNKGEINAYLES